MQMFVSYLTACGLARQPHHVPAEVGVSGHGRRVVSLSLHVSAKGWALEFPKWGKQQFSPHPRYLHAVEPLDLVGGGAGVAAAQDVL